jgi:hypothetical protein
VGEADVDEASAAALRRASVRFMFMACPKMMRHASPDAHFILPS